MIMLTQPFPRFEHRLSISYYLLVADKQAWCMYSDVYISVNPKKKINLESVLPEHLNRETWDIYVPGFHLT